MNKLIIVNYSLRAFIVLFLLFFASMVFAFYAYHRLHGEAIGAYDSPQTEAIRSGDIIFQTSTSAQSQAIQLATHSRYSHMGLIFENVGDFYVYEAVQPVKLTPLQQWIDRGEDDHYVIKRLKNAEKVLTDSVLLRIKQAGEQYMGKPYDIYFEWSDDKIYCSELVWKMYKQATNLEIGQLEELADFDLSQPAVQAKMKERYGNNIPLTEKVISPAAMFNSDKLITVKEE